MDDKKKKQNESEEIKDKEIKKDEAVLLKEKIEELENQVKRTLADYRNLENRIQNERGEWILKANKQLLLNLLPVLDTLILANKNLQDQGLTLSIQQFLGILKQEGVVRMGLTRGLKFDPNTMYVVSTQEVGNEEERVIEELRNGYKLYDSVLRPAQVIVGSAKSDTVQNPTKQNKEEGN